MVRKGESRIDRPTRGGRRLETEFLHASAVIGLLAAGGAGLGGAGAAFAQSNSAATTVFDIPPQPLAGALTAFGIQSGLQVAVDSAQLTGLRSNGVKGAQSPEQALTALLSGAGMTWRFSGAKTVVVERKAASDGGAVMLDPITVAGERVTRSLMTTASSVAVFDAETIARRPEIGGVNSLTEGVANMVTTEPSSYAPSVRGVDGTGPASGATAFFAGVRPRLTLQVDGRPTSFNEMIFGDASLWDVQQVEVFRGAQSTVHGRNSIAGAIVVKTKDPTYTPEASARVIIGSDQQRQFSAMVSGPLVDGQVAARLAVDRSTSDSRLNFASYTNEDDPGEFYSTNLRAKLLVEPKKIEGLRLLLTLNHSDHKAPQGEYVARPFDTDTPRTPQVATSNPRVTSGVLDASWVINDRLTFENNLSYTDLNARRHAPTGTGNVTIEGREGVLEPRLRFSALDGRLNGFGGYYGLRANQNEDIDLFGGHRFNNKTSTDAAFGEATLTFAEVFDVTTGVRYEREHRRRHGGSGNYATNFDETYTAFLPKLGLAWRPDNTYTLGVAVSRGYNGGGAGMTFSAPFVTYTYEPEYVWTYEAYTRAELLGGRLRLTGNLFYADYKDLQLPFQLAAGSAVIRNADRAAVYGSEIGARWMALPNLELFGEVGLLKTEILEYPGSGYEGRELPRAPALTAALGVNYRPVEQMEIGVDARYSEAYFSDVANTPRGKIDPYWVVNAHAGYDFGTVRAFAFARNLFNTETPVDIQLGRAEGIDSAAMLKPLSFGVGMQVNF